MFCMRARALMTQKSCAVGMRNAKPGNHLKETSRAYLNKHVDLFP